MKFLLGLLVAAGTALAAPLEERKSGDDHQGGVRPSFSTKDCPGYKVAGDKTEYKSGFTVPLTLAGSPCNAYGKDISDLTLAVVYEKRHQLHVHVYDTAKKQYQLPNNLIMDRPSSNPAEVSKEDDDAATAQTSDLEFHHEENPFAFWITRRGSEKPLFDTRAANIPTYDQPMNVSSHSDTRRNTTAMPNHQMIFENQYLQLSSALPVGANIYGLGERYSEGGYGDASWRLDPDNTLQPYMTLDAGDPLASNMYGYHPVYVEVGEAGAHTVAYQNTAGLDLILRRGVIQYRAIGGTLDFRFFSGDATAASTSEEEDDDEDKEKRSSADQEEELLARVASESSNSTSTSSNSMQTAMEQYVQYVGLPLMTPLWSFGFHMLRWGYKNTSDMRFVYDAMKQANIPLETLWSDIDWLQDFRNFIHDPERYGDLPEFVGEINKADQHYIPIVDAAIPAAPVNDTDVYEPGTRGLAEDVFLKNSNGTTYIGQVWPGYTYFVDEHHPNASEWWYKSYADMASQIDFSGIWQDMNEPSSFCIGSCGRADDLAGGNVAHVAATSVDGWPEGYDNNTYGNSGNITVKGVTTYSSSAPQERRAVVVDVEKRADDEPTAAYNASDFFYSTPDWVYHNDTQRYLVDPPYAIHNGILSSEGPLLDNLNKKTVSMEAQSYAGDFYDLHNIDGTMLMMHTYEALRKIKPKERPFIVGRSTYPGAGKYVSHWLGDNYSKWQYMSKQIQGLLQFQLFGIPTIGADTCGFNGNTDEELCNRWMMLSAFAPFYRNHNTEGAISQEPFRWDSVANASRIAINKRLELLPEIYTARARSSQRGTPMVKSVWYEFPSLFSKLKALDNQYMLGSRLLVSPVLEPNVTTVKALFPEAGGSWRNIFTHEALDVQPNQNATIEAPLSTINVHQRPGSVMLAYAETKYTVKETAQGPYKLLVNLNNKGKASGDAYVDDGTSMWPTDSRELTFTARKSSLKGSSQGKFSIDNKLGEVVVMGVETKPKAVKLSGKDVKNFTFHAAKSILKITGLEANLNEEWTLTWS